MKDKNNPFPNRTFTDEQLENMSYDDMMLSIYRCQKVQQLGMKECKSVSHQLLRILLRIVGNKEINLNDLYFDVRVDELDTLRFNDIITEEKYNNQIEDLIKLHKDEEVQ